MKFHVQRFDRYTITINGVELPVETDLDWHPDNADNPTCKARFVLNDREFVVKLIEQMQISPKDIGIRAKASDILYGVEVKWHGRPAHAPELHDVIDLFLCGEYQNPLEHPAVVRAIRKALRYAKDRNLI